MPLNINGRTIEFPYVDYLEEMTMAKRKAADYYFAHGQKLMNDATKSAYRQANSEFKKVKEYVGDYENIDQMILDSRYLGISRAYVRLNNNSALIFPSDLSAELLNFNVSQFNKEWVEFYTTVIDEETSFDYIINVNINNIGVSPDNQFQNDTLVKKQVEDGFDYVLDAKGNVKKDSLGNDIKIKKYKYLQCALVQTLQVKECNIQGNIEIVSILSNKVIRQEPIAAVSSFEHISARAIGDVAALNAEQQEMIKSTVVPFPNDLDMVVLCTEGLKVAIRDAVSRNRGYIN